MQQEYHRTALNNDVMIPQLGFGVFKTPAGEATFNAVTTALNAGYHMVDTASVYGNEESVGQAIAHSDVDRSDIFVTTKIWNDDIRKFRTKEAYKESLERLGMDYVDLLLIHWPADGWQKAWDDLQELYSEGSVRAIGVSNFEIKHLQELLEHSDVVPQVDQVESSPQFTNQDLIDFAHEHNIAVEAWSPLGGSDSNLLADTRLLEIGEKYGKSSAQIILRWDLQRNVIPLPKSVHDTRIIQNRHIFDFELDPEEMKAISAMHTGQRNGADPNNFDF